MYVCIIDINHYHSTADDYYIAEQLKKQSVKIKFRSAFVWLAGGAEEHKNSLLLTRADSGGSKNRPAPFPGWMSYRQLNQVLSILYLIMFFYCVVDNYGPFYVLLVFVGVFCLLVVLIKLSVVAKWLARKTPLRKPNRGNHLHKVFTFFGLLYCLIGWYVCLVLSLHDIVHTPVARYSMFVLKVPLNKQLTN